MRYVNMSGHFKTDDKEFALCFIPIVNMILAMLVLSMIGAYISIQMCLFVFNASDAPPFFTKIKKVLKDFVDGV